MATERERAAHRKAKRAGFVLTEADDNTWWLERPIEGGFAFVGGGTLAEIERVLAAPVKDQEESVRFTPSEARAIYAALRDSRQYAARNPRLRGEISDAMAIVAAELSRVGAEEGPIDQDAALAMARLGGNG